MRSGQSSWLPLFRALVLLGLGGVWAVACGGPQEPGAAGSVCFRTDDCKDGLACVPSAEGSTKQVCSSDLSGIVSMVDGAPLEAAAPHGDAAGGTSGGYAGSGAGTGTGGSDASGGSDAG